MWCEWIGVGDSNGKLLGIDGAFLVGLAKAVIAGSKDGYPELAEKQDFILNVIEQEEEKFVFHANMIVGLREVWGENCSFPQADFANLWE